jgi:unsaturated rhamnogalacturonyl hydrolase
VSDKVNPGELWDDTLFMAGLFLARYGQASGRAELVDEAVRQFLVHTRYLSDPETGLWFHGWTFEGRHNFARARWARGNAWVTACILDLFETGVLAGQRADVSARGADGAGARRCCRCKPHRAPGGRCSTTRPAMRKSAPPPGLPMACSRPRGRASAGRTGRQPGRRAVGAVLANIDAGGTVQNVSYGTRMGHDLQFYRDIPLQPTGYGQALAILCLVEAEGQLTRQEAA